MDAFFLRYDFEQSFCKCSLKLIHRQKKHAHAVIPGRTDLYIHLIRDGQEERMRNLQEYSDSVADSAAGVLAGSVLQLLHNAESVVHYRVFRNSVDPYDCSDSAGIVFSVV